MPKVYFKPFTPEDEQKIKDEFLLKPVKRLADELGTTYGRIMRFLKRNNLEIPKELVEKRKLDSQKKKGSVPFNKGKKQKEYMDSETIKKVAKTCFKKGNKPHNTKSDGVITIRKDKSGLKYKYIRISEGKWQLYHRYLWEKHNGKIPKGHIIAFKDGNQLNTVIENLEMITKIENMYRNSYLKHPREIIPSLVLCNKLETKLKKLEK